MDYEAKAKELAKSLGDKLIARAGKYLEENADPTFLRELAEELAEVHVAALAAVTEKERDVARRDIEYIDATVESYIMRHKIRVRRESLEAFNDVLEAVGEVVGTLASVALSVALKGLAGGAA